MSAWMLPAAMVGSSVIGGLFGMKGQKDANAANLAIAREQMAFQERMSNSAHQREVEDLRLAGLNPILSSKYGGASTPSGATAVMKNAYEGLADSIRSGVSSAAGAFKVEAELENLEQQNELLKAQTVNTEANTFKAAQEGTKLFQELPYNAPLKEQALETGKQTLNNLQTTGKILNEDLSSAKSRATRDIITDEMLRKYPEMRELEMLLQLFGLGRRSVGQ